MCSMSVHASSTKTRSCETTTTTRDCQVGLVASSWLNHITAWMLRWFVGSSNKRTSGLAKSAAARATRTRQPPLSAPKVRERNSSLKPRFVRSFVARSSAESASMASRCVRHA
mmetsp:Transcript_125543/g.280142  ORF Transcript_125543/g.280142 Transcript_125543/m.280142 type:complete len:113 (-) Transcript_125543:173-511(-)